MSQLVAVALVTGLFGLGAWTVEPALTVFGTVNLAVAAVCLLAAAGLALRHRGFGTSPAARRITLGHGAVVVAALVLSVALERVLDRHGPVWDATSEGRYTLSSATRATLVELPAPVRATLYHDVLDTRTRSTRLLLDAVAEAGPVTLAERRLDEATEDVDKFGIGSSNSVVLEMDGRFELVERPTEGTLYEALQRLSQPRRSTVWIARGEGEMRFDEFGEGGYSGLAAALETEGYTLRDLVLPSADALPPDDSVLLIVGPERPFRDVSLQAIDAWLARGGRLVALLEPGADTGLEALLERWGFGLPDDVVIDPASGPIEGDPPGLSPIVFQYANHPIVKGLGPTRMLFFRRTRPVEAVRKPEPEDEVRAFLYSSRHAWVSPDVRAALSGRVPTRPDDATEDYVPLAAAGLYPRPDGEARIVVFGDADFASNRYLRALYNLDVLMNAVHWAAQREPEIAVRPKALTPDQFPMTPQQSLNMLFGVGLVVPELCLLVAALLWVRRRSA
jgi:hypothetical protein